MSASGQPEGINRANDRILEGFRHGASAEAGSFLCRPIGEHRELHRRAIETGQFQLRVERCLLAAITCQRLGVGALKLGADVSANFRADNTYKTPRLA